MNETIKSTSTKDAKPVSSPAKKSSTPTGPVSSDSSGQKEAIASTSEQNKDQDLELKCVTIYLDRWAKFYYTLRDSGIGYPTSSISQNVIIDSDEKYYYARGTGSNIGVPDEVMEFDMAVFNLPDNLKRIIHLKWLCLVDGKYKGKLLHKSDDEKRKELGLTMGKWAHDLKIAKHRIAANTKLCTKAQNIYL